MDRHSLQRLHLSLKATHLLLNSWWRVYIAIFQVKTTPITSLERIYVPYIYCYDSNDILLTVTQQIRHWQYLNDVYDLISLQCKQLTNVLNFVSKVSIIHIKSHKVCSFNLYNTVIILWKMSMKLISLTNDNPVSWPIVQTKLIYSKLRILFLVLWIESPIPT